MPISCISRITSAHWGLPAALFWCALVLLGTSDVAASSWFPLSMLDNASSEDFGALMSPFMVAMKLSYTATSGGYYNPADANATIPGGFAKVPLEMNPSCGARGLAFWRVGGASGGNMRDNGDMPAVQSTDASPLPVELLIVYRGTDLTILTESSQCDICADAILSGTPYPDLPWTCHFYNASVLDYFPQAIRYAEEVLAALPALVESTNNVSNVSISVRFTGHSLGAQLAAMMSLRYVACGVPSTVIPSGASITNAGALVLASPSVIGPLLERIGGSLAGASLRSVYTIADAFDPIFMGAEADQGLFGQVCVWQDRTPSAACLACAQSIQSNATNGGDTADCGTCMTERHILKHYLILAADTTTRPVCDAQPPTPSCGNTCNGTGTCTTYNQ